MAKESYHEKAFNAETAEKFQATAESVRREMDAGGRYQYVKPDERKTVDRALAEMQALFAQSGSVEAMNQGDKVKLFNAQEVVNSILTRRDGDRVICKDKPKLGSHIPTTSCHNYAQEEEAAPRLARPDGRMDAPRLCQYRLRRRTEGGVVRSQRPVKPGRRPLAASGARTDYDPASTILVVDSPGAPE